MTNPYSDELKTQKLEFDILPPLVLEFKLYIEGLRLQPLADFREAASELIHRGFAEFLSFLGIEDPNLISSEDYALYVGYVISTFNSVMPKNYPYIVALVFIKEVNKVRIAYLYRKTIQGIHDVISQDFVPLVILNTMNDLEKINSGKMKIDIKFNN
ncbi:MAG: hypothetical protein AAB617_00020 [Patescibacteria group bacterium]